MKIRISAYKGGPSSGNWGHDGRIGKVGGSQPGGGYARLGVYMAHNHPRERLTTLSSKVHDNRKRAEEAARQLAKDLRFDPKRVHFQYNPYNFVIDDEQMTAAGSYNPATGVITTYPGAYSNLATGSIQTGIMAHEIMHDRWNTFKKIAEKQQQELNDEAHKFGEGIDAFMRPNGELVNPADREKYSAALLYESILNNMHLPRLGGVSDYSNHYWAEWDKDPSTSNFTKAVNETLAECARLWHNTERPDLYKAVPHEWQSIFANVREYARKASSYD